MVDKEATTCCENEGWYESIFYLLHRKELDKLIDGLMEWQYKQICSTEFGWIGSAACCLWACPVLDCL